MQEVENKIKEYEGILAKLKKTGKECSDDSGQWANDEICLLEDKLAQLKHRVYANLTPWQRIKISRHTDRPKALDYIRNICDTFNELHGDRNFRDDPSIVGGLAYIGGRKFIVVAQEKGKDTESRLHRNFGMPHPEGYRKALRLMQMAEKFQIPVLCLIDTPGAYCGLAAEERGQGWAIAENLMKMARLKTEIICVLIGEGSSGGAIGIGVGDSVAILENSYYSVISPEACASILWKDSKKSEEASKILKMHGEDLKELGVVDTVIKEPLGGAHTDPVATYRVVKDYILEEYSRLEGQSIDDLLEKRYNRFRNIGAFEVMKENVSVS